MFLLLTLVSLLAVYGGVDANCHLREMDLCTATMLIAGTEGVPGNDEEMDRVCEPVIEGFECVGNYSKLCFTPLMQEIFEMVMAEPRDMQKQLCTHGTDQRAQYLKNAPCFQKVLAVDNIRPHIDDFLAALEKATEVKFDQRIPILCCGIQRMFGVVVDMVRAECGEGVLEEGSAMIGLPIASLQNMFCRGFERGSSKCAEILPPPGTQSKGTNSDNQLIRFVSSALANFT